MPCPHAPPARRDEAGLGVERAGGSPGPGTVPKDGPQHEPYSAGPWWYKCPRCAFDCKRTPHSVHGVVELLHRLDLLWNRTDALS